VNPQPLAHGAAPSDPAGWYLDWPFVPAVWLTIAVVAWLYLRAARRIRGWPGVRRIHWLAGLAIEFVALAGPVAAYESSLFSVHMVQHLLLTMLAAPLLLLGAPFTLALRRASPGGRRQLSALLNGKLVRFMTHPTVTWTLFAAVITLSHIGAVYNAALENEGLHVLLHAAYLGAALLFWWPVIGLDPSGHRLAHPLRLVYLLLTMPVQAFLALAIYSSNRVLYSHYETLQRTWGPSVLDDQRAAAVVMWVGGDGAVVAALVFAILAWMRYDDRVAARWDRRAKNNLAV
jgi:putative membrane protein